jgi:hypothetical protein
MIVCFVFLVVVFSTTAYGALGDAQIKKGNDAYSHAKSLNNTIDLYQVSGASQDEIDNVISMLYDDLDTLRSLWDDASTDQRALLDAKIAVVKRILDRANKLTVKYPDAVANPEESVTMNGTADEIIVPQTYDWTDRFTPANPTIREPPDHPDHGKNWGLLARPRQGLFPPRSPIEERIDRARRGICLLPLATEWELKKYPGHEEKLVMPDWRIARSLFVSIRGCVYQWNEASDPPGYFFLYSPYPV